MQRNDGRRLAAGAALLGLLALAACDKGTDLGVDLPAANDVSAQFLDLPLGVSTVLVDSLQTLKADHFLAGQLRDNVAGLTTATAVLNLQPSSLTDSLPAKYLQPSLDSVIFTQGFDVVYGSTAVPAAFNLVELTTPLTETGIYNSSTVPALGATAAANLSGRLDRTKHVRTKLGSTDTTTIVTVVPDPVLRLVLYKPAAGVTTGGAFSSRLFRAMRASGTSFGQAELDAVTAGLALVPAAGYDAAVVGCGRNVASKMAFYFHDAGAVLPDDARRWHSYNVYYGPSVSGTGAALARDPGYYTYLRATLPAALAGLADGTQAVPAAALNNLSYVQDGLGLGTRLDFTAGLAQLRGIKDLAINRAELFIPVKPYTTALLPAALGLFALEVNAQNQVLQRSNGSIRADRVVQADGGSATGTGNEALLLLTDAGTPAPYYRVSVTSYLQAYLNNQLNGPLPAALLLLPTIRRSPNLTLNRSTLDVGNAGRSPRLRVYYTKPQ